MVRFVDVPNMRRWLISTGIERAIEGIADTLVEDFRRWEQFDRTARVASHSDIGVIELMPTSDGEQYGFKYVNGHPSNPGRGLQTVTAFGVLADVDSGYPTLWTEMTILTALRTAATSAMVARVLAPADATTMAMIGTGSQAEFQALAFRALLGITHLRVWDTDPNALDVFERNMRPLGFEIVRASSAAEAVAGAQIITTCTADKANATVLTDDMVGPGVHINAIGGDCPGKTELDARILHRAEIFVEYPPQTRIEGEIQQLDPEHPVTELWRVLRGEATGRASADQITVFDSVGFAVEDFSALRYLAAAIEGTDFYTEVDIIAEPEDPKNLFALVAEGAAAPALA
ncbi:ornithine cyclodeaminase [Microbacterium esteraromaticum]|uniref:ornithine cyclodeaminase n=1 Tax=Microbacterium esteraromaticum TaxID=57043 RepID=UPI002367B9C0|nr:ornithine cyclodeaminase [Microbacterium esteraromaticum]WDH79566.1 ornithine cyclodeaminase [Microbacterium esteraromaticum]